MNRNLEVPNVGLCFSRGTSGLRSGTGLSPDTVHRTAADSCHLSLHNNWPSVLMISRAKSLDNPTHTLIWREKFPFQSGKKNSENVHTEKHSLVTVVTLMTQCSLVTVVTLTTQCTVSWQWWHWCHSAVSWQWWHWWHSAQSRDSGDTDVIVQSRDCGDTDDTVHILVTVVTLMS